MRDVSTSLDMTVERSAAVAMARQATGQRDCCHSERSEAESRNLSSIFVMVGGVKPPLLSGIPLFIGIDDLKSATS